MSDTQWLESDSAVRTILAPSVHPNSENSEISTRSQVPAWPGVHTKPAKFRHGSVYVRMIKPIIDTVGALVLLAVSAPLLLVVALLVRVHLGPGVLYRQERFGRNGRRFTIYKFRTMAPDRRKDNQGPPASEDRRRCHKVDTDPRHTELGRCLRRLSLDELPQFWNVVRGEMSLVGPRPELTEVVRTHYLMDHPRHLVRPGLTGVWQISPERSALLHESVHLDVAYVENVSLKTDTKILIKTAGAVLGRLGR